MEDNNKRPVQTIEEWEKLSMEEKFQDTQRVMDSMRRNPDQWKDRGSVQVETTEEQREKLREMQQVLQSIKTEKRTAGIEGETFQITLRKEDMGTPEKAQKICDEINQEALEEVWAIENVMGVTANNVKQSREYWYPVYAVEHGKLLTAEQGLSVPSRGSEIHISIDLNTLSTEQILKHLQKLPEDRQTEVAIKLLLSNPAYKVGYDITVKQIDDIMDKESQKRNEEFQEKLKEAQQMKAEKVLEIMRTLPEETQVEIATRILDKAVTNKQQEEHGEDK